MQKEPFEVSVSDEVLTDLNNRLVNYRWPKDFANDQWQFGTNADYLKELVDHWFNNYDWRTHEKQINSFLHFKT